MASSEYYQPIRSVPIEGHSHQAFQDIPIGSSRNPFPDGHLPFFSLAAMSPQENPSPSNLVRISKVHGRSFGVEFDATSHLIWNDEYGTIFTALNTKGNNLSAPEVFLSGSSPSGYSIFGMQESDSLLRALKASEILRAKGVATEVILKAIEPLTLPFGDETISRDAFEKKLIEQVWDDNAESTYSRSPRTGYRIPTRENIPDIVRSLSETTFFITVRGVQTNERLADLDKSDETVQRRILQSAFQYFNLLEQQKVKADASYTPRIINVANESDREYYFTDLLPRSIAQNIAGFHKAGLVHYFPHTGNISTVGTFYDLDSVRGEPIGLTKVDEPITFSALFDDLKGIKTSEAAFTSPSAIMEKNLQGKDSGFNITFIKEYIRQMGWVGDIRYLVAITELRSEFQFDLNEYVEAVEKQHGLSETILSYRQKIDIVGRILNSDPTDPEDTFVLSLAEAADHIAEDLLKTEPDLPTGITSEAPHWLTEKVISDSTRGFMRLRSLNAVISLSNTINDYLGEYLATFSDTDSTTALTEAKLKVMDTYFRENELDQSIDNIFAISDAFGFVTVPERRYVRHYAEQLAILLHQPISTELSMDEMIASFHTADQEEIENYLTELFEETRDVKNRRQVLLKELGKESTWAKNVRFASDRYNDFIVDYSIKIINERFGEILTQFTAEYGEESASKVKELLEDYYITYYCLPWEEEETNVLYENTDERVKATLAKYLLEEGFNPSRFPQDFIGVSSESNIKQIAEEIRTFMKNLVARYHEHGGFAQLDTHPVRDEILTLLEHIMGEEYNFTDEDKEQLIIDFLQQEKKLLSNAMNLALEGSQPEDAKEYLMEEFLEVEDDVTDTIAWKEWLAFSDPYLRDLLTKRLGDDIENMLTIYYETEEEMNEARDVIYTLFIDSYQEKVTEPFDEDTDDSVSIYSRYQEMCLEAIEEVAAEYHKQI